MAAWRRAIESPAYDNFHGIDRLVHGDGDLGQEGARRTNGKRTVRRRLLVGYQVRSSSSETVLIRP